MANFSKSFNFRGGFQVDTDTLIVRGQNVGIGSSVPTERLDVNGIVKAKGLIVDSTDSFFIETASVGVLSATQVEAGVYTGSNGGVAVYYGDGSKLSNLPTSQWVDIDVGLGFTSIYSAGNVGVDTNDPRYVFQVGGVPFGNIGIGTTVPAQRGVAIQDGYILASDGVRVGGGLTVDGGITVKGSIDSSIDGDVSIGGSVTAEEFIGIGSQLTELNADNLTSGSIGSMRYGELIVTKEVIADRFIGTASFSLGLATDARVIIDTIVGNGATFTELDVKQSFISTEGYISLGAGLPLGDIGDIEIVKGETSSIYSISTTSDARVFVGKERPFSTQRQYGGIQALSGDTSLDLINYDVGNLNYILHGGAGGQNSTTGEFRWIYGQNGNILATLAPNGTFKLNGNGSTTAASFEVSGITTVIGASYISGELYTTGNAELGGDVSVGGELTVTSDATVGGDLTVTGDLVLSGGIDLPGSVDLDTLNVTTELIVGNANGGNISVTGSTIDLNGTATITGSEISITNVTATNGTFTSVGSTNLQFSGTLSNTNTTFSADQNGDIRAVDITSSGTVTANSVSASSISGSLSGDVTSTNTSTFNNATITNATITDATITDLTLNSTLSAPSVDATSISADDLTSSTLTVTSVSATASDIGLTGNLVGNGNNNFTQLNNVEAVTVEANTIKTNTTVFDFAEIQGANGIATSVRINVSSDSFPDGGFFVLNLTPYPPQP